MSNPQSNSAVYDLIGVGFGPSNLALAIALSEIRPASRRHLSSLFLERQRDYRWHGNTLVEHSRLQVSFLKDLVSMRNPTSRYSFINYLHEQGRLTDFINLQTFFPYRFEFDQYLRWAAKEFDDHCLYGEEVLRVEPVTPAQGPVRLLDVVSRDAAGRERRLRARSVVIGTGGSPRYPEPFAALRGDARVFHYSNYLESVNALPCAQGKAMRVAVVGAGQSAAEAFIDLHERFPDVQVDIIARGFAMRPSDDSPFVNEVFNPAATDIVYGSAQHERDAWIQEFKATNYSVVDPEMIAAIYQIFYRQRMTGQERHRFLRACSIEAARADGEGILIEGHDRLNRRAYAQAYDAVVLATGFDRVSHRRLLAPLADRLDDFAVARDYRLASDEGLAAPIYAVGYSERSHGLSDTLLSVLSVRAAEVARAVYESLPEQPRSCSENADYLMSLASEKV